MDSTLLPSTPSTPSTLSPLEAVQRDLLTIPEGDKQTALQFRVLAQLFRETHFALVGLGSRIFEGGLRLYACPAGSHVFRPINEPTLRRLIVEAGRSLSVPIVLTGTQTKRVMETFVDRPPILTSIERRVFQVGRDLFYNLDAEEGEDQLVHEDQLPPSAKCFFRLFDSQAEDKDVVIYPESTFDSAFSEKVMWAYNSLLALLDDIPTDQGLPEASLASSEQISDPLPRHFPFIEDWAAGNPGLYWDLMTIPATVFIKEKPQIVYFLSGSGANGKSSYLGLIHTMLGTNNTTRVRLSEMSEWHFNTLLQYTLFNAPDDEGDALFMNGDTIRIFKSFAAHATVSLPIMRSQEPMALKADFMSAHPMNAAPDWGDVSSASALTRRTCLVPFTADFKGKTPSHVNFAKSTFTPDVLAQFTGEVLALATFYSTHPIRWSKTVTAAHDRVEEENDSISLYKKAWQRFFISFQNTFLLYDDYVLWCKAHSMTFTKDRNAFIIHWYEYTSHSDKGYVTGINFKKIPDANGKSQRRNILAKPGRAAIQRERKLDGKPLFIDMFEDTILPFESVASYGTIAHMHHKDDADKGVGRTGFSAVVLMETVEDSGY